MSKKQIIQNIIDNNPVLNKQELLTLSIQSLIMIEIQTEIEKLNFKHIIAKNKKHENN